MSSPVKIAVICLGIACISGGQVYSQQYEMSGTVSSKAMGRDGAIQEEVRRDFSVTVNDCQWMISTTSENRGGQPATKWTTSSVKVSEILSATYYTNGFISGIVESNVFPSACEDSVTHFLWFAFASACYLDGVKDNKLPPIFDPIVSVLFDAELRLPAIWDRMDQAPRLPIRILFLNDGYVRSRDSQNRETLRFQVGPPFSSGFTNAVLVLSGVTNFGRLLLPTGFRFVHYSPGIGPDGIPQLTTSRTIEAEASQIRASVSADSLMPKLPRKAVVQDRRLLRANPSVGPIVYHIMDGRWPEADQIETIRRHQIPVKVQGSSHSLFKLTLVLILFASPLAYYVLRRQRVG